MPDFPSIMFGLAIGLCVGAIGGGMMSGHKAAEDVRQQAIENGVGYYSADPKTGKTIWVWKGGDR